MGLRTYTIKIAGKEVQAKLLKAQAEHFETRIHRLDRIRDWTRELTGIIGQSETTSDLWSLFGPGQALANEEQYQADLTAFLAGLPTLITQENGSEVLRQAADLFNKHVRIVDKRETPEQHTAKEEEGNQIRAKFEAQAAQEAAQFRAKYGVGDMVQIPQGMMAVYLSVNFDDSDIMTDYFNNHHSIGCDMLLVIVPQQGETERLARNTLAQYPELAALSWEWKTEKYSMGHGNYLESGAIGTEKRHAYDGREEVGVWYEVEFSSHAKEMHTVRGYPGIADAVATPPSHNVEGVTVRRNEAHNGIEVIFPDKPEQSTMDQLKSWGFRWSRYQGLWYAHYNLSLFETVKATLCPEPKPEPVTTPV